MRNIPLFAASALLMIWLLGGSSWYAKKYCDSISSPAVESHPLIYLEDGLNEIAKAPAPAFHLNEVQPLLAAETVYAFAQLATYLNAHPDRLLILTGHSHKDEINEKIGLQRAEAVAKLLTNLGAHTPSIVSTATQKGDLHFDHDVSWEAVTLSFDENEGSHPDFMPLNLYFSAQKYLIVSNRALEEYAAQLKDFLSLHPELVVQLTGFVDKKETSNPADLSRKRAKSLLGYLVKLGIPARHLHINTEKNELVPPSETAKNRRVEIRITRA